MACKFMIFSLWFWTFSLPISISHISPTRYLLFPIHTASVDVSDIFLRNPIFNIIIDEDITGNILNNSNNDTDKG